MVYTSSLFKMEDRGGGGGGGGRKFEGVCLFEEGP